MFVDQIGIGLSGRKGMVFYLVVAGLGFIGFAFFNLFFAHSFQHFALCPVIAFVKFGRSFGPEPVGTFQQPVLVHVFDNVFFLKRTFFLRIGILVFVTVLGTGVGNFFVAFFILVFFGFVVDGLFVDREQSAFVLFFQNVQVILLFADGKRIVSRGFVNVGRVFRTVVFTDLSDWFGGIGIFPGNGFDFGNRRGRFRTGSRCRLRRVRAGRLLRCRVGVLVVCHYFCPVSLLIVYILALKFFFVYIYYIFAKRFMPLFS